MLVHVEQGLGFQDGLLFGEGVEGVQAEFVLAGIVVKIAERDQFAACPLGKGSEDTAFAGGIGQVIVRLFVEIGAHGFDFEVHHVAVAFGPGTLVAFLAAEGELFEQAALGEHLVGRADQLGQAMGTGKDADDVAAADNPDLDLIIALRELPGAVDIEQFRMQRPLKEIKIQFA